jgi:hypothetical protein
MTYGMRSLTIQSIFEIKRYGKVMDGNRYIRGSIPS